MNNATEKTATEKTATEAFQEVSASTPLTDTRFVDKMDTGQWVRQGDVYLVRIESIASGSKPTTNRQLAPGSTLGSRHTVGKDVEVFTDNRAGKVMKIGIKHKCFGPQLRSDSHFLVMHPEHAHISLPPGCYQVQYQVDPMQMKQVAD